MSAQQKDAPAATASARRRTRLRLGVVIAVSVAVVGVLAASGLDRSLVFYRTTSELAGAEELAGQRVRLGGLVKPGSVHTSGSQTRFVLTDGSTEIPVLFTGRPGGVFRAGQNALVEGTWAPGGVFRGERLMVKHSENYRGPDDRPYTPPPLGSGPK